MAKYFHAASCISMIPLRLGDLVDHAAYNWGGNEAVSFPFQNIMKTFKEVKEDVDKIAAGISSLQFQKGDRVVYFSHNCYESYVFLLAAWKSGLVVVMINTALRGNELKHMLKLSEPKAAFLGEALKSHDLVQVWLDTVKKCDMEIVSITAKKDERIANSVDGWLQSQDLGQAVPHPYNMDDTSTIFFTSGTTGVPKAVTFSHHSFVNNSYFAGRKLKLNENDKICNAVQLYYGFGTEVGLIIPLLTGCSVVFPSFGYNSAKIHNCLDTVDEHKSICTILAGSPTILYDVAQIGGSKNLKKLIYSGSGCTPEQTTTLRSKFPEASVVSLYGISEAGFIFVGGELLDHVEARVTSDGELLVRSYSVTKGYWKDKEKTRESISEAGWFATGDICRFVDEKWEVFGRIKEQINVGGAKVHPREVEDLIYEINGIEEVHVFGVKDTRLGEKVAAWVKLKAGFVVKEEKITDFCKGRIAHFKIPSFIKITRDIPKIGIDKVSKKLMAEMSAEVASA